MVPVVYRLNFRDASSYFLARQFDVRDKDIVYVSDHPLADMQKFLSSLYAQSSRLHRRRPRAMNYRVDVRSAPNPQSAVTLCLHRVAETRRRFARDVVVMFSSR